jgi:hypothetical protein
MVYLMSNKKTSGGNMKLDIIGVTSTGGNMKLIYWSELQAET